jgi:hypothetical protein
VKPLELAGTKGGNFLKKKLMSCKQTVRTKISETYRGINKFKKGYEPITNIVKGENGDLLADSRNILNRRISSVSC